MLVDTHMHIYESGAQGQRQKDAYSIVEYGPKSEIQFSKRSGHLTDALDALDGAKFDYAVVANLFCTIPSHEGVVEACPGSLDGANILHNPASAIDRLMSYNRWVCDISRAHHQLVPFISLDPWVMSPDEMRQHLTDMASRLGARGVKLHPTLQRFAADDARMLPVYRTCAELQLPVLLHSGRSSENRYSEPRRFRRVLRDLPRLKLIMAHLGGSAWNQCQELAADYPNLIFDCAEIVAWIGAPLAPTQYELATLIRNIGAPRVLLGTDFPWYDIERTAEIILELPILSQEEKELILGQNAANMLQLPT